MRYLIIILLLVRCQPGSNPSQIVKQRDSVMLPAPPATVCPHNVDSILRANDSLIAVSDTLAKRLLHSRLVISNVKYYVAICNRKPDQTKFLRGWLNRALQ